MDKKMQSLIISPNSIESYIRAANEYPILTAEEEKELSEKVYYYQDVEAAKKLILSHLRFVVHIARGYLGYGLPHADLIQEGNVGLMKAVKRFNPEVGVRLVSFAVHWIKAEIHEYVLKNWRIVKVATTKAQRKLFFNLRKNKQHTDWLNYEEIKHLAKELNVDENDVKEMEMRLAAQDSAFDMSDDDSDVMSPAMYLEDKNSNFADDLEEENKQDLAVDQLQHALSSLDERSQEIVKQRWLNEPKATLGELAERFNISAERVRQIENNAFKKLKLSINY